MISLAQPLPVGNAVRVILAPAAGAIKTRVLRKTSDNIASETDAGSANVYEGDGLGFIDTLTLLNGTPYFYRAFDLIGANWVASPSVSATPAATGQLAGPDPIELVRSRFEQSLKADVTAGRLKHEQGYIPCLTAPPAYDNVKWPLVTIHLKNDAPAHQGLGGIVGDDIFNIESDIWGEGEGYLSRVSLDVCAWALNSEERKMLRKAIKKAFIGNLGIFAQAGMVEVEFSTSDVEDFENYNAPVYQSLSTLTCLAPSVVESDVDDIADITVDALAA